MKKINFGITKDGELASRYILENSTGMEVEVSDFGVLVLAIRIQDKSGEIKDVVLGFENLEEYYNTETGFGAYIGRNGNRIEGACVVLDGVEYKLDANNNGNNLHSGNDRSHTKFYQTITGENEEGAFVEFSRTSPHMEQGFPGNLKQKIRYTLTDENEFLIDYEMASDRTTVVNPTNHSYFNLAGHKSGTILNHEMEIDSDGFLLNDGILKKVAKLYSPESGIGMEVYTDLCGLQVYSGNFLRGEIGKDGVSYQKHDGICFETQFYPNACKEPSFPSSILPAEKVFRSRTIYKFVVEEQ